MTFLFDLDGTIMRTFYSNDQSFLKAFSRFFDIDISYPYWKDIPHHTDRYVFEHLFKKHTGRLPNTDESEVMRQYFVHELSEKSKTDPDFFTEIPGSIQFLNTLVETPGVRVGIATGSWESIAHFKLSFLNGLSPKIKITGCDIHPTKSGFVQQCLEAISHTSSNPVYYYGDSLYDWEVSSSFGFSFTGVDFRNKGVFSKINPPIRTIPHYKLELSSISEMT